MTAANAPVRTGPLEGAAACRWAPRACGVVTAALVVAAVTLPINPDEIEHVHAAWLVAGGSVPYRDFFQHHHPLLWFALAVWLPLLPDTSLAIVVIRLAYVVIALITSAITWRLARFATGSPALAWLAVLLLMSTGTFLVAAIEVRPDPPMVLSAVLSAWLACRANERGRPGDWFLAGLTAGVAVLFLQKALLFVAAIAAVATLAGRHDARTRAVRPLRFFAAGLILPLAAGGMYFWATRSVLDYVATNWTFNAIVTAEHSRIPMRAADLASSALFWILAVAGAVTIGAGSRPGGRLRALAAVALIVLGGLAAFRALRPQYLLQALPFLAVTAAWTLQATTERRRPPPWVQWCVIALIVVPPLGYLARVVSAGPEPGMPSRAAIDYVLAHSALDDAVYDPRCRFNLFRRDLDYLGGSPIDLDRRVRWFARVAGPRFTGYDACALIEAGRPRFILDLNSTVQACGLGDRYGPTPFERLHARSR